MFTVHWRLLGLTNIPCDLSRHDLVYESGIEQIVEGILVDFDVAVILEKDSKLSPPFSDHRTVTAPFVAHELLNTNISVTQTYRHDLESFFYVLIWIAVGYKGSHYPNYPGDNETDPLYQWRRSDWNDIYNSKASFFYERRTFDMIVYKKVKPDYTATSTLLKNFYSLLRKAFTAASTIDDYVAKECMLQKSLTGEKARPIFEQTRQNILNSRRAA